MYIQRNLQNLSHEEISDKHRKKTDEIINTSNLNRPEINSVYTTMKKALRYSTLDYRESSEVTITTRVGY